MENTLLQLDNKVIKQLRLIDHNGKKHCKVMVEVNFAPGKPVPASEIEQKIFHIIWEDHSTGNYQLIDICRFNFGQYMSHLTLASHGMDHFDFYIWFKGQHPEVNAETMMAAYFYRKIE